MFGKLCKLELRYMMRNFLPIWGVVLVLAALNGVAFSLDLDGNTAFGLLLTALVGVLIAMAVLCLVLVVQRFYEGLLKNEGYLMFTLPVKTGSLILSKGLAALVVMVVSGIVGVLAFALVMGRVAAWMYLTEAVTYLFQESGATAGELAFIVAATILLALTVVVFQIQMIYLAQAIGHMASSHRVGMSVLAYLAISVALSTLGNLLSSVLGVLSEDYLLDLMAGYDTLAECIPVIAEAELVSTALYLAGTVLFFFLTRYILDTRLNLE
ncbi:MAG: hypothetical protein LUF84_00900 [Clostridiales bacterium]|nr:hypothetical protein [Clostridiales bacterium]